MDINDRIKNIQGYFKSLNMVNGATVVLVKFPGNWKIFDEKEITDKFGVYTGKKEKVDGIFFIGEMSKGTDCIFDAIEYVVTQNKALEERAALLEVKAKELSNLFLSEPLEKLKTLEFTFNTKKSTKKAKNSTKTETTDDNTATETPKSDNPIQVVDFRGEDVAEQEDEPVAYDDDQEQPKSNMHDETEDSDVMDFMKEIVGEDKQ